MAKQSDSEKIIFDRVPDLLSLLGSTIIVGSAIGVVYVKSMSKKSSTSSKLETIGEESEVEDGPTSSLISGDSSALDAAPGSHLPSKIERV